MKMTFEISTPIAVRFRRLIPSGKRSELVNQLLAKRLKMEASSIEAACRRANDLKTVSRDMKDWERLNESDDSAW